MSQIKYLGMRYKWEKHKTYIKERGEELRKELVSDGTS